MTATKPYSYGSSFNMVGGGVYAMQLEDQAIKIWHWQREDVPDDITEGKPKPWEWGTPMGNMDKDHGECDVAENFHTLTIVRYWAPGKPVPPFIAVSNAINRS
jgi:hypothetical protein